jgi:hypothetical protein
MGDYVDYIKDFPGRIIKLYDTSLSSAKTSGLEVTLLLSLVASGISVPLYRLRKDNRYPDPFESREMFPKATPKFDKLYEKSFIDSELWDTAFEEWRYGECDIESISNEKWERVSPALTVKDIITHLRDSLAHGVILTDRDEENQIKEIQLFTDKKKKRFVLRISPGSLEKFLRKWVDWLQTLDVSIWPKNSS